MRGKGQVPVPAPPRGKKKPPEPPALVSASLARIEAAIGGREALVAALSHAPKSADFAYILGLIGDPQRARSPLATLCAMGGITAGELIEAYKAGEINRAQAEAIAKVGARLGEVAADTMRLSIPHEVTCDGCYGEGLVTPEPSTKVPDPQPETCKACRGTGILVKAGDLDHKKLALDLGKLLPKSGGMNLNVNQQVGVFTGGTAGGSLELMQAATDAILYGEGAEPPPPIGLLDETNAVDGEMIEASSDTIRPDSETIAPEDEPRLEGDWREDLVP